MSLDYEKILGDILEDEETSTFWSGRGVTQPDIYRLEKQNFRWYYKQAEPVKFYTSITTWLDKVMPTPWFLQQWYKRNTLEYVTEKLFYTSEYGTFSHIMGTLLKKHGRIDLSQMDVAVNVYWEINQIEPATILDELATKEQWIRRIKNDLLCQVAFIQEREFQAVAIEWIGSFDGSDEVPMKYCCAIDNVAEITFNGTRKMAIIDDKSGNLYPEQVYQLIGCKLAWDQHNPEHKIELLMNWTPKDFSNKGKFKLKNRKVDSDTFETFKDYARIASRTVNQEPSNITDFDKELSRDSDLSSFEMTAEQYVKSKHS